MAVVIDRFNEIVENHASFVALVGRTTSESILIFTISISINSFCSLRYISYLQLILECRDSLPTDFLKCGPCVQYRRYGHCNDKFSHKCVSTTTGLISEFCKASCSVCTAGELYVITNLIVFPRLVS